MIKLSNKKEAVEIKDFGSNGDEIKVEFINSLGEKMVYTLRVSRKCRLVMN